MKRAILFVIICIFIHKPPLSAQNNYTFPQFGKETVRFVKQPSKWRGDDYLSIGLFSAGTGLMMMVDQPIRTAILKDRRYYHSFPIEFGRMYGELYSPIAFFGCFAGYSLITNNMTARKIAYEIGQSSLYAGTITIALKVAIGRARPYLNECAGTFRPFHSLIGEEYHSFPSAHTTAAFTISTVLSSNAKPTWLKILLYVPAALTFTSRVYQDWHWTSDNIAGAAFGYFIGKWVVNQHRGTGIPDTRGQKMDPSGMTLKLVNNLRIGFGQAECFPGSLAPQIGNHAPVRTEQRIYMTLDAGKIKFL